MKTMNLKQKIKDHKTEIVISVSALIGIAAVVILTTKRDDSGNLIVAELIGDAATGEPLYLLTEFGAFDLIPHVE